MKHCDVFLELQSFLSLVFIVHQHGTECNQQNPVRHFLSSTVSVKTEYERQSAHVITTWLESLLKINWCFFKVARIALGNCSSVSCKR
jgi:hypothetical protein